MVLILTILCIAMIYLGMSCIYIKKDAIENGVLSLTYFFFAYVVTGAILFWLDSFSVISVLVIEAVIFAGLDMYIILFLKKRPTLSFDYKKFIIPLLIFLIVLPVTASKFGYFGMGQDQGVYQTKALALINGYNSNIFNMEEFDTLNEETDISAFRREVSQNLVGYYTYDSGVPSLNKQDFEGTMSGVFHGIPTFSAMLALCGMIFGYMQMAAIQSIFLFCAIFLCYYVLRNLKVKKFLRIAAVFMFAISPLVLWTSKSSLTEVFISVIIMMFLYVLTDVKNKHFVWLSFIEIAVFSFYHVTIYTVMPMFYLIYIGLYFTTKDKRYLWANTGGIIFYLLGFFMMVKTSGVYTCGNYREIFLLGINAHNYVYVVTVIALSALILNMCLIFVSEKYPESFRIKAVKFIRVHLRWIVRMAIMILIAGLLIVYKKSGAEYNYTTIYAYIISTGFIMIPFLFLILLYKPQFITADKNHLLFTIMFFYTVVMYSCVMKPSITYYYYYGRYIVPYIPVVVMLVALRLDRMQISLKFKRRAACIAAATMFMVMLPYNWTLLIQDDDTWMSWEIIEDLSHVITDKDAVLIEPELAATLKFPLKIMTGADTYPRTDDMVGQVDRLEEVSDNVYYIGAELWIMNTNCKLENVYSNTNMIQEDLSNTDQVKESRKVIPFSLEFSRTRQNIIMFRCTYDSK